MAVRLPMAGSRAWLRHLPTDGVRAMCSWERFCAFAREPVTLLWGLFDQELFVEHDGKRFGPFQPSRGAVPLYRYRKYQKSKAEERLDKVVRLADQLGLPRAAVTGGDRPLPSLPLSARDLAVRTRPFPEPVVEKAHPTALAARQAIAAQLCRPLGSLPEEDRRFIVELLSETLDKITVADRVRERLQTRRREG